MIILQTEYPCHKCYSEIDPTHAHCEVCGEAQPPVDSRLHYNIFMPYGIGVYGPRIGAHILSLEDVMEFVEWVKAGGLAGCYVGAYVPAERDQPFTLKMTRWMPIGSDGNLKVDEGEKVITITNLEHS